MRKPYQSPGSDEKLILLYCPGPGIELPHTVASNLVKVKKQSRLDVRKYSFSQRTINVWNKLSTDCVHASSVNMFKNKIDKYLAKAGYT